MIIKEKHIRIFVIIIIISIVLSGATILSYVRVPRVWLVGIIGGFFLLTGGNNGFKYSIISKLFLLWILFLFINYKFSYTPLNTRRGLIIFISLYFMMSIRFKENELLFMLKVMRVICVIYAFSILLAAIFTGPFYSLFHNLIAQSMDFVYQEISTGAYSGIVGERALAAYFMNVGVLIELSDYFISKRLDKNNFFNVFLYTVAIMMTGKRMLFAIEIVFIIAVIIFSDVKGKWIKLIGGACIILPVFIVLVNLIPQTQVLLQRMSQYSGDDMLNGRQYFWDYCLLMFSRKPIIGYGFDSFNTAFADEIHYVYKGRVWDMYAHNIYYELLGEVGIVGIIIFICLLGCGLYMTIRLMKNEKITNTQKKLLFCAMGFQLMFIIYGFTGNCLYENEQLMLCFVGMLIATLVSRDLKINKRG